MRATKITGLIGLIFLAYVVLAPLLPNGYVFAFSQPDGEHTAFTATLGLAYIFAVWGALVAGCIFIIAWAAGGYTEIDRTQAHENATGPVEVSTVRPAQLERQAS